MATPEITTPVDRPSWLWRLFGALCMEDKNGVQAVSLHRIFALVLGSVAVGWWTITPERPMPSELLYSVWGVFGITGGAKWIGSARAGKIPLPEISTGDEK